MSQRMAPMPVALLESSVPPMQDLVTQFEWTREQGLVCSELLESPLMVWVCVLLQHDCVQMKVGLTASSKQRANSKQQLRLLMFQLPCSEFCASYSRSNSSSVI
ncbi:hypothetical protein V5799_030222 [Amblyomma americanum]|uniref:Uncharacterized protein n=1 Tax=Amblyomma americanum TaxID=6943 RepID=A0AAQ4ENV9_AMBAM